MAGQAALSPENDIRLHSKYPQIISGFLEWLRGGWVFFLLLLFIMKALLTSEKEDYLNHFCMDNTHLKLRSNPYFFLACSDSSSWPCCDSIKFQLLA